ncbi:hypothetical protein D9613_006463 [Agrocybe pediades]|uniref:F-box domain-containing protein n=1 Tax=Agrocybe pediades TaxID=84607 RepID=A0A8H4QGU7_9AGAR|nr:hypothetical protein D9613_006463 [Agrocybe pediades]
MVHLSTELDHAILRGVRHKPTLKQCRLVSKLFEAVVAPFIWQTLRIVHPSGSSSSQRIPFETISKADHISPYVKSIDFDAAIVKFPDPVLKDIPGMVDVFSHFQNFRNLETLYIHFPRNSMETLAVVEEEDEEFDFDGYDPYGDEHVTPERKIRTEVFKKISQIHLEHGFTVSTLVIQDLYPVPHTGMRAEGLPSFMKSLQKLVVSVSEVNADVETGADPTADEFYSGFKADLAPLLSAAMELRALEYEGDQFAHGFYDSHWDSFTFPHLESLSLENVAIRNDSPAGSWPPVIHFILRHRETLQQLHLGNCIIDSESPIPFTWREVFSVFKERMKNLREFTFTPLPGRDEDDPDCFSGYGWWDTEGGYSEYFTGDGEEPADAMADRESLQALQMQLEQR